MADAFSLAVNTLTVLEIGRKFAILAWDIYNDNKHGIPGIASLEMTSKDLDENASQIQRLDSSSTAHLNDPTNERVRRLAKRCTQVAAQMQETLRGLSTHKMSHSKRGAVIKAFKYKWKENDISAFQMEIKELRDELMLNLVISLRFVFNELDKFWGQSSALTSRNRNEMKKPLPNQDAMVREFADSRGQDQGLKERLDQMIRNQEGFGQLVLETLSSTTASVAELKTELAHASQITASSTGIEDLATINMPQYRLELVQNRFLNIFRYDTMFDREAGVAEAHEDTLKWIFEDSRPRTRELDTISQWLESGNQLYWITGKMGSGKSTLMKYISGALPGPSGERRCTPHLLRWTQGIPLFIGTFYFWAGSNEGTGIQTSVDGLYRTVITQILQAYPDAAPRASPRRWQNLCLFNEDSEPPETTELQTILSQAIEYVSSVAKICLFIDGLDELEGNDDDLLGLIGWVQTLTKTSPVKLCVASRPWRVFEDVLQDRPHLLMEDLNYEDIQKYVWRRFHDDPNFRAKKQVEADFCDQLLNEIITKAEGVFLWVHLVCTNLLRAMSRGDLISRLRRILRELPDKMERLYDHILANLEPYDMDHAAKYLLLMQACFGQPDAILFSFADDIGEDSVFALEMAKASLTDAEIQYRITELRKRLTSRCRGLLVLANGSFGSREDTVDSGKANIQYCHRSTKDYLTKDTIRRKLIDMLDAPFDPNLRLCSAQLAEYKSHATDAPELERWKSLYKCVEYSKKVAIENNDSMIRVLDNLDPDFANLSHINSGDMRLPRLWFGGTFLSLAVALGADEYVRRKVRDQRCAVRTSSFQVVDLIKDFHSQWTLGRSPKSMKKEEAELARMQDFLLANRAKGVMWPLLLDAFLGTEWPDPQTVSMLLENGANPNVVIQGDKWKRSALGFLVLYVRNTGGEDGWHDCRVSTSVERQAWVDSLCFLLQHGAKLDVADAPLLRKLFGEDVIRARKVPRLGHHRGFISLLLGGWRHHGYASQQAMIRLGW